LAEFHREPPKGLDIPFDYSMWFVGVSSRTNIVGNHQ
jgi:hypothetical protein